MMRRGLAICALLVLAISVSRAQVPTLQASRVISCGTDQLEALVACDQQSGTTYVAGWFTETLSVGEYSVTSFGGLDAFLVALDRQLNPIWLQQYGGIGRDQITALQIGRDGDLLVAMYCGSNTSTFTSYQIGDVILGGRGEADAVIARIRAADGTVVWVRNDGGTSYEVPNGIVELNDAILVSGYFHGTSRFGTDTVTHVARSNNTGYIHALSNSGEHLGVAVPVVLDTSNFSGAFTWVGTALGATTVYARLTGARMNFNGIELDRGAWLVELDSDLVPREVVADTGYPRCTRSVLWSTDEGSEVSVVSTGTSFDECDDPYSVLARPSRSGALRAVATSSPEPSYDLRVSVADNRMLISGWTQADSLDLLDTPQKPDLEGDGGALGFTIGTTRSGLGQWVVGVNAPVVDVAATRTGFTILAEPWDTLRVNGQTIPAARTDLAVLQFTDPTVSVQEIDPHERHPEPRSGEGPLLGFGSASGPLTIHDLTGRLLGTVAGPVHSDALRARLLEYSGPLILRQGTRVSLCHVYGPDHIAFALPAGSPR